MKRDQSAVGTQRRLASAQWLSLALISLLASLPVTGFVRLSGPSSAHGFSAPGQIGPTAIGTIFTVTSTDDTTGVCPSAHCTLRGAILAANGSAGDDGISFAHLDPGVYKSGGTVTYTPNVLKFDAAACYSSK